MWNSKGSNIKRGQYDVKGGNMMCKLQGRIDKAGLYDVEMKRWRPKGAL